MNKKTVIWLVVTNMLVITIGIVYYAYLLYPQEAYVDFRINGSLKPIYKALQEYKAEHGSFPNDLSGLHYDEDGYLFLDSKKIDVRYHTDPNSIKYELINNQPVLTDLGYDEGNRPSGMDVTYPIEYQKPFHFSDFIKTSYFNKAALFGFILASMISICLYGIWTKLLKSSTMSLVAAIILSIGFLLFELFLALCILGAHVYPHH